MTQRVYHGNITPEDLATALVGEFNRNDFHAQAAGGDDKIVVQISTPRQRASGGSTALSVTLQKHEDGVLAAMGDQEWLGVAASLGQTALSTLQNPWNVLNRLDDVAADLDSLQLPEKVWAALEKFVHSMGAAKEISERLRTTMCPYCQTANAVGAANCIQCGAPLGTVQPDACPKCGYVNAKEARFCGNCGNKLGDA